MGTPLGERAGRKLPVPGASGKTSAREVVCTVLKEKLFSTEKRYVGPCGSQDPEITVSLNVTECPWCNESVVELFSWDQRKIELLEEKEYNN